MADIYVVTKSNQALAAATAETVIQLVTPATVRARIVELGVFFDGITSTAEPVDVALTRQTTAGTASAGTVTPIDAAAPTGLVTAQIDFSAEPTSGVELGRWMVHPQGGAFIQKWDLWAEAPVMAVSTRLGIICTAAATVNVSAYIRWVE